MTQPEPTLRARLVSALQAAAFLCDDDCTLEDEAACDAAHPIQATCLHFDQVADIAGPIDDIADVALAVVQPELDRQEQHVEELQDKLLSFGDNGGCCCSYDNPGDVCMVHSPTVRKLEADLAGLEETAAARAQDAQHWQERATDAEAELSRLRGVLREHAALLPSALAALLAPRSGPKET